MRTLRIKEEWTRTPSAFDSENRGDAAETSLTRQAVSALTWNFLGAAVRIVTQVVAIAVLARVLGPRPFGTVAAAWFFITLGTMIGEMGLGSALVQRKTIESADVQFVFTVQMMLGMALTLLTIALAPLTRIVFHDAGVVAVVRVLGFVFVLQSFGTCALSMLRRSLDFKAIQIVQGSSYIVGYVIVGIPLAILGAGIWSLVAAHIGQSLVYHLGLYALVRHSVRPTLSIPARRALLDYGTTGAAVNIVNWAIQNVDNLAAGRFFGTVPLALYSRVYALLTAPIHQIVYIMHGLFFSIVSRVQDDVSRQRTFYVAASNMIGLAVFPVALPVALVPSTVIEGLYGESWSAASSVMPALALAMPLYALVLPARSILWGRARVRTDLFVEGTVLGVLGVLLFVVSDYSVVELAWAVSAAYALRLILVSHQALRVAEIPRLTLVRSLATPLGFGACVALGVKGLDLLLTTLNVSALLRLLADAGGGLLFVLGGLTLGRGRLFHDETRHVLKRVGEILPVQLGSLIRKVVE